MCNRPRLMRSAQHTGRAGRFHMLAPRRRAVGGGEALSDRGKAVVTPCSGPKGVTPQQWQTCSGADKIKHSILNEFVTPPLVKPLGGLSPGLTLPLETPCCQINSRLWDTHECITIHVVLAKMEYGTHEDYGTGNRYGWSHT